MTLQNIAEKYRRALRKGRGATFTFEQLQELACHGVLEHIAQIEAQELCPEKPLPTSSVNAGSISGAMARHLTFGKLRQPANDQSFIAALTAEA
jgi:hypothetical protein